MQSPTNFRVKIDLSQFYDDVRKLSYVFVSENHISHILHLHQRIKDVFGINRPFYLISDGEVYLPLNEDIRIVKENETVKVCPGSGVADCLTVWREMGVKYNGKPLPTIQVQKKLEKISELLHPSDNNKIVNPDSCVILPNKDDGRHMYVTELELQCSNSIQDDSDTDTTNNHSTVTRNVISEFDNIPSRKRKRVRKRKPKQFLEDANTFKNLSSPSQKKLLELNSNAISTTKPKHFKFNWEENEEHESPKYEEKKKSRLSEVPELKTLLNLRNSQFPVTFVGHKLKKTDVEIQEYSGINSQVNQQKINSTITEHIVSQENIVEISDFSQINPLNFPAYNQKLLAGDVVAFRTLKMADDYSPTVSGYIVAEILSGDTTNSNYSFKILNGEDQLKNPEGKFSLPTDDQTKNIEESSNEPEIYTMNCMELIEPSRPIAVVYAGRMIITEHGKSFAHSSDTPVLETTAKQTTSVADIFHTLNGSCEK